MSDGRPFQISSYYLYQPQTGGGGAPSGPASGDLTGNYPGPTLVPSGIVAGTYGNSTNVPQVTFDAKGRAIAVSNVSIAGGGGAPSGPASGDLTGTYPGPTLVATGVAALTYGAANLIPQIAVDAKGRITSAANVPVSLTLSYAAITLAGAGDTSLTTASGRRVYFFGAFTQNVILPSIVGSPLAVGYEVKIVNMTSGLITIFADAAKTQQVTQLAAPSAFVNRGGWGFFTVVNTAGGDILGNWSAELGTTML